MTEQVMHETDVVVIGAGAAGIAAARRLTDEKVANVLLEARGRIGGRAVTVQSNGYALDLGCGYLHSADKNDWTEIAPTLGFTVDRARLGWDRPAITANFPEADQEKFWRAFERLEERAEEAEEADIDCPVSTLLKPGGRWNALIDALATYIDGVELDQLTAVEYDVYRDTEVNWRVREGYGALIAAYAKPLDIRLGCPATLIDHSGKRLRIATPQGDITARAAIVAVPPTLIGNETLRFAPALPAKLGAARALPLGVADKVFLAVDRANDLPVETVLFGSTTRTGTGLYSLRPFGWPVIQGYFGGACSRALEMKGEGAFAAFAIDEICAVLGNAWRARLHPIVETAWARDPWSLGSYSYAGKNARANRAALAEPVDERLFFAGEHCSDKDFSTAHGAYRTGRKAAKKAIRALGLVARA
jgi:monoamine oxidase